MKTHTRRERGYKHEKQNHGIAYFDLLSRIAKKTMDSLLKNRTLFTRLCYQYPLAVVHKTVLLIFCYRFYLIIDNKHLPKLEYKCYRTTKRRGTCKLPFAS